MIIDKNWLFSFRSASANLFTYECDRDEDLIVVIDMYEMSDIDLDSTMGFIDLIEYDQLDVYYNCELIKWEAL
jgi:hypothetical protein